MNKDHDIRNLSNPKIPDYSSSLVPKFVFGKSDPQGFTKSYYQNNLPNAASFNRSLFLNKNKRDISNNSINSNISHNLIFKVK
jgi:hypothetical protein